MGEGRNFRAAGNFFRYQIPCMKFFLGHSMNIFLGLIGVQEFFSFNFPLREYFFCTSPPPPTPPLPPISFLMVRSLKTLSRIVIKLITNDETRDDNSNRRVTPTVK